MTSLDQGRAAGSDFPEGREEGFHLTFRATGNAHVARPLDRHLLKVGPTLAPDGKPPTKGVIEVYYDMPTYIYETTDATKPIRQFEVRQSVHDDPLRLDPETGEAVRRVISAGYGILVRGGYRGPSVGSCG